MICRRPAPAWIATLLLLGGAIGLQAQTVTWTGLGTDNNTSTPANWLGNTLPLNDGTEEFIFGPAARSLVWFSLDINARKMSIVGHSRPYQLDEDAGILTLGTGGLYYAPAVPVTSYLGSYPTIIPVNQPWNIQSGELEAEYHIEGVGQINKTGVGVLVIGEAQNHVWTGGLKLTQGTVAIRSDYYANLGSYYFPLGHGTLVFDGGTLATRPNRYNDDDSPVTLQNSIVSNGLISTRNENRLNLAGTVTLNTDTTINNQGDWLVIDGAIADGPTSGPAARKLAVDSNGSVILAGTNTYTGGTHVENGTLVFATVGSLPAAPAANALTSSVSGYIGFGDDGTTNAGASLTNPQGLFLDRFNKASTFGTIGFDTDPDLVTTNNYTGNIDLSATPTGMSFAPSTRLGSATHAILSGTITPQGTAYRFGGGGGFLEVNSQLTDQTTPTAAARSLVVDSPAASPLTLAITNQANDFSGGISVTNSGLILGSDDTNANLPAGSGNISINAGGYVGFRNWGDSQDDYLISSSLARITSSSIGMVGFDKNYSIPADINLGSFTGALYLGTATPVGEGAGLTLSGIITPAGGVFAPYRFAGYKGGALEVASPLTGANGVHIGDPNSPGTFGDYLKEEYSSVALTGNNNTLTGPIMLYGGQLLVGQHASDGIAGTDPTHALGSGTLEVVGMTLPPEWQRDGEGSPAPQLGTTTTGLIIPNNVNLTADLNIAESNDFALTGKISGPGELYLERGDSVYRTGLTLTNDSNDFTGGIYLSGYSRLDVGSNHATGTGPLGFGYSSNAEMYFHTTAPVIGGLMSNGRGDYATLYAQQTNTVLTINQSIDSMFRGEFRSNGPYPADNLRIVKGGSGTLRLDYGGMYFYHGTTEFTLPGTPEVGLQVNQGALVLGNNFSTSELSATTTWIHGGTLTLDDSTHYSAVVIDNGGLLTGSGTVAGAVSLGSTSQTFGQVGISSGLKLTGGLDAANAGTTVTVAGGSLRLGGTTGPNIGTIAVGPNAAVVFDAAGSLPATAINAATGSYVGLGYTYLQGASFGDLVGKLTPAAFAGTLGLDNSDGGGSYSNTGNLNLAAFTHLDFAGLGSISDGLIESTATITAPASGTLQFSGIDGGKLQVDAALLAANGVSKVTIGRTDGHGDAGVVTLNNTGNNYTGGTDVLSGILMIGRASDGSPGSFTATPYGTGALTLHGGTALQTLDLDWDFTVTNAINLPGEGAKPVTIHLGGDYLYLTGALTGPGALNLRNYSYGELHLTGDNSGWSGGLKVNDDAIVFVDSPTALGTGVLSFNPTPLNYSYYPEVRFTTPTAAIGGLSGGFNDNTATYYASTVHLGSTALTINQGLNSEFKGSITDSGNLEISGSITKTGPGTLILSGQNNYLGTTTVSAGTLQFARQFSLYNNKGLLSDGLTTGTWTALNLIVAPGATAAFNVGGTGEFTATDIDQLKNIGTGTDGGGFQSGSILGLDTTNAAGGNFTYAGIIADPNDLVNSIGLTKLGTGTLTLTAASTYTGPTLVNAGTLSIGIANALPTTTALSLGIGATLDVANNQTVANLNSLTPSSVISIPSGRNLTVSGTGNSDYMGNISGAGLLVKAGAGTLFIRGDAAHTGGTSITAGTLSVGNGGNTGTLTGNVSNQANLIFNRFDATTFAGVVFGAGNLTKAGAGTLTLTGTNTYSGGTTITGGTLSIGAGGTNGSITGNVVNQATLAFNRSDATTYAGVISGTGHLLKTGAGNLTLTGANTYAGNTTVSGGSLTLGVANALPVTTQLLLTNGSVLAVNFNQTIAGFFGASDPASLLQLAGVTFTVAMPVANVTTTFAGNVAGTGTFAVSGAGNDVVNLTGTVASTIATQIGAGATLVIGSGGSLSGPITTNGVLSFDNPGSQNISGVISGTGGLLATAGITTLSGNNTYTGPTDVFGGKLLITGSNTGGGIITVGSGGVFGGTGTTTGDLMLNSGGTVSPGASPGILAVGDTTFAGGGRFAFEINDTAGTPGTSWDLLSISGNLVITATPSDPFVLDLVSLTAGNTNGLLTNFDNTGTYSWQFLTATGSITGFSAGAFQYNPSQFQNSLGSLGGHFFVSQSVDGHALSLNFKPIPEPSTYALLAVGLGLLGLTAWRQRRAS